MRNYVVMFLALAHMEQPPLTPVDLEIWASDRDELDGNIQTQRALWTGSGWTFTIQGEFVAYWLLNKANFTKIIKDFAVVNVLAPTYQATDPPILQFEDSPRGDEIRKDALIPLDTVFGLIGDFRDGDISDETFADALEALLD